MAAETSTVTQFPLTFSVAHAPTVTRSSTNKDFTIKSLADMIGAQPAMAEAVLADLIAKHGVKQGTLEAKKLTPILYFGQYPDGVRVRNQQNIEAVTAVVFDFDGRAGDNVTRQEFLAACKEHDLQVLLHDSFSSNGDGKTFRAIFPCAPLAIDCYQAAALSIKNLVGLSPGSILPATQGYFYQSRPGKGPNVQALFGRPVNEVLDFEMLEAIAGDITPSKQASNSKWDELDMADHMFDDAGRELYARCLKLIEPWSKDRTHWISIVGAGLRGWGLTPQKLANPETITERERYIINLLEEWGKNEHPPEGGKPKYEPGCVIKEGFGLYAGEKKLGLRGMVQKAHDSSPDGIGAVLEGDDELNRLAMVMLGHKPPPIEPVIDIAALSDAPTERQADKQKARALADRQALAIHEMPASFGRVRDWVVEFASKGELTSFDEVTDDYRFAIDPISAILAVGQLLSVVMGGRVWVNQNNSEYPPTQLNLYVLRIAGSGTGKSTSMSWLRGIMNNTAFKHSLIGNMSFSVGGFWPNTFDRVGYNVFQLTDEGANLIASHIGNNGSNLKTLHTMLLSAYSAGHERGELEPPLYSTGGKTNQKSGNNFEPIPEPNLNIHAIGTHELMPLMNNAEFMQSGFSARFIVRIEPKGEEETAEDILAREMRSCFDPTSLDANQQENPLIKAQDQFAQHLVALDRELFTCGRGCSMSNLVGSIMFEGDVGDILTPAIYKAASIERQKELRDNQYIMKSIECAQVMAEARMFFAPYVHDNSLLEAVRHREVEKLTKLSAIYTLGRDPDALFIEEPIARYLMGVLQMAQLDFIKLEQELSVGIPPTYASKMKMLEREVKPKGMLYEAGPDGVPAKTLRQGNRAWRELLKNLGQDDEDLKTMRQDAKRVMASLGVVRSKGKGETYTYFMDAK